MKATLSQSAFLTALTAAKRVAQQKGVMPILACVRLTVGDRLMLDATNLSEELSIDIPAERCEPGAVCVDAADLLSRVAAMPDGPVTLTVRDNALQLGSPDKPRRFKLGTLDAEDFPKMHAPEAPGAAARAEGLRAAIRAVGYAVSQEETRIHMNCMQLVCRGGKLQAVATDGHRFAMVSGESDLVLPEMLIPLRALAAVKAVCSEDGELRVGVGDGRLFLSRDGASVAIRLTEAHFPPWEQVVPKSSDATAKVDRAALLGAAKAVATAVTENGGALLTVAGGELTLAVNEDAQDSVPCEASGDMRFGMNVGYLIEALAALEGETVEIGAGGELDPVTFRQGNCLAVIMPMRL